MRRRRCARRAAWRPSRRRLLALAAILTTTAGCSGDESAYARAVADYEPVYCYRSLAAVTCHARPDPRDARRLVNFYGPAPSRYPAAASPKLATPGPPPAADPAEGAAEPLPATAAPAAAEPGQATPGPGDWRFYLPFLTVLFGVAQVAAAFLL